MASFEFRRVIDTSLLQDLPDSFYQATGMPTAVQDTNGELVTAIPQSNFSTFCHNMFFHPEGHARCLKSNCAGASRSVKENGPYVHRCHAGLIDVFAPIMYSGTHVGTVCCGQLLFERPTDLKKEEVRKKLAGFPKEFVDKQMIALDEVTVASKPRVEALAKLLGGIANEIVRLIVARDKERATSDEKTRLLEEMTAQTLLEKEVKEAQLRLKESELRLLEAQINPHFLYNTLDSIQWLAARHGRDDIQQMICSLSSLMRYSLNRGNQAVRLAEELGHVQDYLMIQKVRYGAKLNFSINVESEIRDYLIPKLVLQPLVENAIKHGIDPASKPATIAISGWVMENGSAVVEVENDGVHVSEGQIQAIRENLETQARNEVTRIDRRTGFGLSNVHERLRMHFGESGGLRVRHAPTGGICVRFVITPMTQEVRHEHINT